MPDSIHEMQFAANTLARAEQRMGPDGRQYLVAPGTIIVEGVLGNEFVPVEEFGRYVQAWAGKPLPLVHPTDNTGRLISANSPDVIERLSLGYFWNPRLDNDRIRGEYWIDLEKAQRIGGDALTIVERLQANQQVETSTGYFRHFDPTPGVWRGKPYQGVARDIVPDHIAVTANQRGKCSIADGCGLLANSECTCGCGVASNAVLDDQERTGIMIAFYVPADAAQMLVQSLGDLPEGSEPTPPEQMHVTLAYLGETDSIQFSEMDVQRDLLNFVRNAPAVRATIGGVGRFSKDNNGKHAVWAQVDSPGLAEWRERLVSWLDAPVSTEHGFTPHITLAYVPADAPVSLLPPERVEVIFDSVSLSWGSNTIRFPLQGEIMPNSEVENTMDVKDKKTTDEPVVNNDKAKVEPQPAGIDAGQVKEIVANAVQAGVASAVEPLTERLQGVEGLINDLGGAEQLRETLQLARANAQAMAANAEREKTSLVTTLVGNSRCAFTKEELEAMEIAQLSKLAASLATPDYSGRGMAVNQHYNADEWVDDLAAESK